MRIFCMFLMVLFLGGCAESARDSLAAARPAAADTLLPDSLDAAARAAEEEDTARRAQEAAERKQKAAADSAAAVIDPDLPSQRAPNVV